MLNPPTQYATDQNLAARQHFWTVSRREPPFDLFPWVLDRAGLHAESSADVVDLGCGNGRYEQLLSERHHRGMCIALDISMGMLSDVTAAARVQGDAQRLPLRSNSIDVVLAPHMLYHVSDVAQALGEAKRVLRADGSLVAITNGQANLAGLSAIVEDAAGNEWQMRQPADQHFSLENGGAQLSAVFSTVERVDCPRSDVVVTDIDALAGYVASIADHYEDQVNVPWSDVVEGARARCADRLATAGELRIPTVAGAFICR